MLKIPHWIKVHRLLLQYKKPIFSLFFLLYILGFGLIVLGFYLFTNNLSLYNVIFELNHSIGTLSLILFLLTLIPGIFSRFKIFPLLTASLVLFRRQVGILMFIVAIVHSFYVSTIPAIMNSRLGLEFLNVKEIIGSIALIILFPVWLTSNDFSQKVFGKFWKIIQRFAYFALVAIFIHVALSSWKIGAIAFVVLVLEILSWVKVWFLDKGNY